MMIRIAQKISAIIHIVIIAIRGRRVKMEGTCKARMVEFHVSDITYEEYYHFVQGIDRLLVHKEGCSFGKVAFYFPIENTETIGETGSCYEDLCGSGFAIIRCPECGSPIMGYHTWQS
jgi:hypothetical protein